MARRIKSQDDYYLASQWQLMLRKLKKHRLAQISFVILAILYIGAIFGDFIAPYGLEEFDAVYKDCAPTKIYYTFEGENVGPYVFAITKHIDKKTFKITYEDDTTQYYPIKFFVHGTPYKVLGFIDCDLHLFGLGEGSNGGTEAKIFLLVVQINGLLMQ